MSKTHQVTLLPGDWVGPETCEVVKAVFAAAGVDIAWDTFVWPEDRRLDALLASCRRTGVMLKAKLDGARTAGQLPPTVELRKRLGAWVTIRAVRALPGTRARFPGIDLVVIRETSEDIYSGLEHEVADGVYEAVKVTTRAACERVARFAYDYARAHGRKKVSIVHKANIMKRSDGLFLRTAQEIAEDYPEIETEDVIVDALCMRLVRDPLRFEEPARQGARADGHGESEPHPDARSGDSHARAPGRSRRRAPHLERARGRARRWSPYGRPGRRGRLRRGSAGVDRAPDGVERLSEGRAAAPLPALP
jgi:hypothetical protein